MASLDQEIAYQFDCRYVAVMEKMYNKNKASALGYFNMYAEDVFWGLLTQNVSAEYISRHPEKYWDRNPVKPWDRFYCDWSIYFYPPPPIESKEHSTLAELEADIKTINNLVSNPPVSADISAEDYSGTICDVHHIHVWLYITAFNPNLTLEFLEKNWEKDFNLYYLAGNAMQAGKLKFKKEYLAALKIQEIYLQARYNPRYAYCRRKHIEFYQSVLNEAPQAQAPTENGIVNIINRHYNYNKMIMINDRTYDLLRL